MRRLLAFLLSAGLLALSQASVRAQTAAYAELAGIDAVDFPQVHALLDVYDANGAFISGLPPSALTVYEDGAPHPVDTISESAPPVQVVVAVNPGPALAMRNATGVARFTFLVEALSAWANALPAESQDDLSLVSLSGSLINHASPRDWLVSLQSFKPDFRNTTPNFQTLAIALDTAAAATKQPGMKRAVLFITPHMDSPNIEDTLAPLIQSAVDKKIRVFVWFVDAENFNSSPSANAFKLLASQTNGAFFTFSGIETFPDPNEYLVPLRHIYTITYTSSLTEAGSHSLGLYVEGPDGRIPALDQSFEVDVQPPNPIFVAPPLQITRQPPAEDPYNPDILNPTRQELEIIIEFPDGHPRDLKRATLYVDGAIVAENTATPFDKFVWDISAYTETGQHQIVAEVEDVLGLSKSNLAIPVTLTVKPAPRGLRPFLARYRRYVVLGAIGLAGVALMAILLRGRRRGTSTIDRIEIRKRFEDPLTQPVAAITEPTVPATRKSKTQPRKPLSPGWAPAKPTRVPEAPAYLIRLTSDGEPASGTPIPIADKELTIGTDPVQSMYVLDDPSIAPLHARLKQNGEGVFMIYDHGSIAGTWVNFEPVTRDGRRLQHGDQIHFGQMLYRFDLKKPPAESGPKVIRK